MLLGMPGPAAELDSLGESDVVVDVPWSAGVSMAGGESLAVASARGPVDVATLTPLWVRVELAKS